MGSERFKHACFSWSSACRRMSALAWRVWEIQSRRAVTSMVDDSRKARGSAKENAGHSRQAVRVAATDVWEFGGNFVSLEGGEWE